MAKLDTMVTVVDARNFLNDFGSADDLVDRSIGLSEEDVRNVVDLLVDQIEFANVILLNKCDLVDEAERMTLLGLLRNFNPRARIIEIERGQINPKMILGTRLFDLGEASAQPGWLEVPRGAEQPETDEYGITSFVYRARRPFHAARLWPRLRRGRRHPGVRRPLEGLHVACLEARLRLRLVASGSLRATESNR